MPTCPNCHLIKEFLDEKKIGFEEIDATTDEGIEQAAKYEIMSTPIFLVVDDEGREINRVSDIDDVKKIIENERLPS